MHQSDIEKLASLPPRERADKFLDLGAELCQKPHEPLKAGQLPQALKSASISHTPAETLIKNLHSVSAVEPFKGTGIRNTGHDLILKSGKLADQVLTPKARKEICNKAIKKGKGESVEDLAIRQLGLSLVDSDPISRCCGAYAYWQATGAEAAIPILTSGLNSEDEEEKIISAHCLAKIDLKHVKKMQGTAKDDEPQTPIQPVKNSMTIIVHGTFAKDSSWYKPDGDFHQYIKRNVYKDLYSDPDFFFWSGRYALTKTGLKNIWGKAAQKLLSWCNSHPTKKLRIIAHSHGNNVVNMITRQIPSCTLIQLSPPVRDWNLPNMANVSSNTLFNIHSTIDLVVKIDGGKQDYQGTPVAQSERIKKISFFGHSDSHDPTLWKKKNVPQLVRSVCP